MIDKTVLKDYINVVSAKLEETDPNVDPKEYPTGNSGLSVRQLLGVLQEYQRLVNNPLAAVSENDLIQAARDLELKRMSDRQHRFQNERIKFALGYTDTEVEIDGEVEELEAQTQSSWRKVHVREIRDFIDKLPTGCIVRAKLKVIKVS